MLHSLLRRVALTAANDQWAWRDESEVTYGERPIDEVAAEVAAEEEIVAAEEAAAAAAAAAMAAAAASLLVKSR